MLDLESVIKSSIRFAINNANIQIYFKKEEEKIENYITYNVKLHHERALK